MTYYKRNIIGKALWVALYLLFFGGGTASISCGQELSANPTQALGTPELFEGIDAYMKGEYEKTYHLFDEAGKKNPNLAPAGVLIALLFSNDQRYQSVFEYLERAIDESPQDPEALFQLAGIAIQEGRLLEARLLIERGNSVLNEFKKNRATIHRDQSSAENDPRVTYLVLEILSLQANLAQHKNNFVKAEGFIREIIELDSKNDQAYISLGYLLFEQEKFEEAIIVFDKAKEINSLLTAGHLVLAMLLQQEGKTELAQQYLAPLLLDKLTEEETAQYIRLLLKWNRMEEAVSLTQAMQDKNHDSFFAWVMLGEIELYRSQYAAAEDYFRNATLAIPSSFEAINGLALALCDQSNWTKLKQALDLAKKNYQSTPLSQEACGTYAWILFLSGKKEEAESLFAPIMESGKINSTLAYYLAEIAYTKGSPSLAVNFIELAMGQKTNFPKYEAAKELLRIIEAKNPGLVKPELLGDSD